ncbi:hypothetical protein BDP27DRAFT_1451446 [Rhodocollybia butyracea]|uniref:Uncharacterized protein n=1 Tax=Rhodocollybia butyracea TaxID=206335 RepID=A0A9P5U212_9AGAR|nr:hypothetical protein BDP27DRAFT_1451446 [Rhodocollybia butyracea]
MRLRDGPHSQVALLVSSMLASLLPGVIGPLLPRLALFIKAILIAWIPTSLYISFWLLCRILEEMRKKPLLPLSCHAVEPRILDSTDHCITLITYVHAWLSLAHLLHVIHPTGSFPLAVMMVFTLITVVAFGKCLLIAGIEHKYWGHFFDLYTLSDRLLCISIRVITKVTALLS